MLLLQGLFVLAGLDMEDLVCRGAATCLFFRRDTLGGRAAHSRILTRW